jgi:hypothetical protein
VTRLRRQLQTSTFAYAVAAALLGCSSSTPPAAPATSLPAPSASAATPPLASSVAPAAGDHEPLPERASVMVERLEPRKARSVRSIARACDEESTLELKSTGAFDRRSGRWVVVDVEHDLGEPPRIKWAGFVPVSGEEEEIRAKRDEPPTSICSALTHDADLVDTPDLVDANAFEHYATGAASSLVRFDSWLLYLGESEHGDDALHLFRPGGSDHAVIMRRPARVGAFQVTACRRGDDPETSCSPFRAYLGITAVRRAPDRRSLLVQGHAGPPGHAYSGPFHWIVPWSSSVGGGP